MASNEITSVVALHTFMTKMHGEVVYEMLNKFGKSHKPWFRYRCEAMGQEVFGTGRPKGDAKQVVARLMLEQLSLRGYKVPPEFASPDAIWIHMGHVGLPTHSFVYLVKRLCQINNFGIVNFKVFINPAGQSKFTVKARIGYVVRVATDSSQNIATQMAAEQIHKYLRTRLTNTETFNEEQPMIRAYERPTASTSNEETPDEERRADEEPETSGSRRVRHNNKKKNRLSAAVQSAIRLQLDQSGQGGYEVRREGPPRPNALFQANNNNAMNLLSRSTERFGM